MEILKLRSYGRVGSQKRLFKRYLCLLLLLCVHLESCGAMRTLSGIWQQAPLNLLNQDSEEELVWDEGLTVLYELHLGRYGNRVTGVLVRYQTPRSRFLSPFDRADRCNCEFIYQGSALSDPDRLAFTLLDPQTRRSVDSNPNCSLELECQRVFKLTQEDDELVGTTWCAGDEEGSTQQLRFVRSVGIPNRVCEPLMDENDEEGGLDILETELKAGLEEER